MATKPVVVKKGQCTVDIALQYYGRFQDVIDVALKNDTRIIDNLVPGSTLVVEDVVNETTKYLQANNVTIAATTDGIFQGIGYWRIESDFKVS